jgi:hypothetical protein
MFLPLETQNLETSEELACRVQYVKILRTLQDTQSVIKKESILMQGSITRKEHHAAKLKVISREALQHRLFLMVFTFAIVLMDSDIAKTLLGV